MTLADEETDSIRTDYANMEIVDNMGMQVAPRVFAVRSCLLITLITWVKGHKFHRVSDKFTYIAILGEVNISFKTMPN